MKVAIVGGAGVRVPLLVRGLAQAGLGIGEIALFDIDATRLAAIADLSRRVAGDVTVSAHDRPEPCIEGAGFVITSIRVGGARQREEQGGGPDRVHHPGGGDEDPPEGYRDEDDAAEPAPRRPRSSSPSSPATIRCRRCRCRSTTAPT